MLKVAAIDIEIIVATANITRNMAGGHSARSRLASRFSVSVLV